MAANVIRQNPGKDSESRGIGNRNRSWRRLRFRAILGMFWLLWRLAVGHGFPAWPWWGYILAPLGIAVVYFALELLNWPIHRYVVEPDRVTDPTWERGLRFSLLLVIGCGWIAICVAANHYLS